MARLKQAMRSRKPTAPMNTHRDRLKSSVAAQLLDGSSWKPIPSSRGALRAVSLCASGVSSACAASGVTPLFRRATTDKKWLSRLLSGFKAKGA